jgi:UDP-N-acetylglucosamine 2-epimerase (non-hydrolysing)
MKVLNVVGTRPNFVKITPLIAEMDRQPGLRPILVHTGQHYREAMSDQFFSELRIRQPDFDLGIGPGSHATQTAEIMKRIEPVMIDVRPDLVVVVGDVNSTLAAALTAVKLGMPVAHVDAGLRSFDRTLPEEINRVLTDAISTDLFVTEQSGVENLRREGLSADHVYFVGNVMIDALVTFRPIWEERARIIGPRLGLEPGHPFAVLSLDRSANVDDPLRLAGLLDGVQTLVRHMPVVFPVHPRIWPRLAGHDLVLSDGDSPTRSRDKRLICLEPLAYLDFIALVSMARVVLTDSGGTQDETTILGVPCLTLRDTTERWVTVTHGTNRVIGTDPKRIAPEVLRILDNPPRPTGPPPLWDGRAACRIVEILLSRQIAVGDPSQLIDGGCEVSKSDAMKENLVELRVCPSCCGDLALTLNATRPSATRTGHGRG